ncbi:MAG: tyrosine-type recombinase/integrase [bacterium]
MNNWTVTKNKLLSLEEVNRLYKGLTDTKDLSIQRGINYVYIRDYYILKVLLETGLRVSELTALKVSDLVGNSLIVQNGKGGKKRNILLAIPTKRLIREFIDVKASILNEPVEADSFLFLSERFKPYTTRAIRKRVKYWFNRLRFSPSLSVHSCRHTYISHLMASGIDLATIRNNAGHSSLAVTSIYTHVVKDNLGELEMYNSSEKNRTRNYYRCKGEKG